MSTLTIRYTETAQQSIEDQIVHLADYSDLKSAFERLDAVIDALQDLSLIHI